MSPFKSTQSFSVGAFLKTFRSRDAFGPASLNSPVRSDRRNLVLNVPVSVSGPGFYDLRDGPLVLSTSDEYDISLAPQSKSSVAVKVHLWGAGGGSGSPVGGPGGGGAGGFTVGNYTILVGTTYKYIVGSSDGNPSNPGAPGASGSSSTAGVGGGLSGVFATSVSQANAILIAGGGGGTGSNDAGTMGSGGGGGGATAQNGYSPDPVAGPASGGGGTQSAGGAGGPSSTAPGPGDGSTGTALQGGAGGARGNSGAGGGGGGSGYYGGGGGAGQTGGNTGGGGGGGGSGYLHPTLVTNGTTTTANAGDRITTSPLAPSIPSTASKGNNSSNVLSLPSAARGGAGCIIIEVAT